MFKSTLQGFYKLEAVKLDGTRRVLTDWFPNLITNGGLDRIGVSSTYLDYCHVGSGNTAPANTDTGLATPVASTITSTSTTGIQGSSPYYTWQTIVYTFGLGVAAGNLAEVGVGWSASNGFLFSRALILDSGGSPTTVTVLSDEYLYVTYQFRRYIPEVDTTDTVDIAGVTYTWTGRASSVTNIAVWVAYFNYAGFAGSPACYVYDGSIGAITTVPSGNSALTTSYSVAAYSAGTHYADWTYSFGLTQGNLVGQISAIIVSMCDGYYQLGVTPDIPKTADDIMSFTFRTSWARH